ncbi:MAG: hypothetical protein SYNGOMJ08_00272 [Candidatus Syntrophoarchaeum sp. GoM_oil]|nr:MAG: hypothetical protein SYNGOMJ08_00272 [Candidatus Syntrophoarchaeum sp. GoM_oil]
MNKEKKGEIRGFLEWLEREIGAKIDDLQLKTKIKEYYKYEFDVLVEAIAKNKKRLKKGYDPTKREQKERLRDEFEVSMGRLSPVIERIEKTDWLIDQVVYRLYGLSEEEVRVVEG